MKNENRAKITTLPLLPGTVVLAAGMLALFLIVLLIAYGTGILPVPTFLSGLFRSEETAEEPNRFSESFLASLEGVTIDLDAADGRLLSASDDTLLELLAATERPQSLYQIFTVTWIDGSVYRTRQIYLLCAGEKLRAEIFASGKMEKYIVCDGRTMYVWENGDARRFAYREDDRFFAESELGLPSLVQIRKKLAAAGEGASALSLQTVLNAPGISAVFTDPLTGAEEAYELLPDCGAVTSAYCRLPGASSPYYLLTTNSLMIDVSGFHESVFDIPNP